MTNSIIDDLLEGHDDPYDDQAEDWLDPNVPLPVQQAMANADQSVLGGVILVHPWAILATSNEEQAVVLSQLAYYVTGQRGTHSIGADPTRGLPHTSTARSAKVLAEETGQTEAGVDHVLRALQSAGLIDWRQKLFGGLKTRHIWLTERAQDFLPQERGRSTAGRRIAYLPWLAKYITSLSLHPGVSIATIALVASQLYFWYGLRSAEGARRPLVNPPEPEVGLDEPWFYKRNTDLAAELGLSSTKVDRSMSALKDIGLAKVRFTMWQAKRTGQVMLVSSAWQAAIDAVSSDQG